MAMNEMDMGEMMPNESMQMNSEEMKSMESEPQQNPVDIIKADHRKVEDLFKQFEGTEDKKQKFEIAKQVCLELKVHAQYEEELVYPLLKKEDEDTEEEAELEHELIKYMVGEVESLNARDKKLEPAMKVLKELVQHHVEEEEDEALPELKDNKELQGRSQEIMERKTELMQKFQKGASKSRGGRKTAARSSSGRKAASTSKSTSKKGGSTSAKKAAAGRKGGMSKGKKAASSSKSKTKSTSSRGKSSNSKSKASTGRSAAGKTKAASRGGKKSSAVRSGKKATSKRAR